MQTYQARWIFPGSGPPIPDGRITVADGTIVRVEGASPDPVDVDVDLGDVAIVPGFVNAHTHLELGPIPWNEAGGPEDEVAWLGQVIRSRFERSPEEVDALIRRHVRDAVVAGTTALGDITTAGQSWGAVASAPVWATVFAEVIGLAEARGDQTWQAAQHWLGSLSPGLDRHAQTRPGLSPHAPYSTAGRLYRAAAASGLPLTSHLGEMPEEREFLTSKTGPLRQFVASLGAWTDTWEPVGPSPVDYLPPTSDCIVAHGNIFEPAEFARLVRLPGDHAPRVAVAYCPRTHARFGHPPHAFRAMLDAGVVVCLGTDSLASSPSLSILDEVRFLRRHHPDVPPATLLTMATVHGAWALRIDDRTGTLDPGKSADLAVLPLGSTDSNDPHDHWLSHDAPPLATMFRGQFVAGR